MEQGKLLLSNIDESGNSPSNVMIFTKYGNSHFKMSENKVSVVGFSKHVHLIDIKNVLIKYYSLISS